VPAGNTVIIRWIVNETSVTDKNERSTIYEHCAQQTEQSLARGRATLKKRQRKKGKEEERGKFYVFLLAEQTIGQWFIGQMGQQMVNNYWSTKW